MQPDVQTRINEAKIDQTMSSRLQQKKKKSQEEIAKVDDADVDDDAVAVVVAEVDAPVCWLQSMLHSCYNRLASQESVPDCCDCVLGPCSYPSCGSATQQKSQMKPRETPYQMAKKKKKSMRQLMRQVKVQSKSCTRARVANMQERDTDSVVESVQVLVEVAIA